MIHHFSKHTTVNMYIQTLDRQYYGRIFQNLGVLSVKILKFKKRIRKDATE